MIQLTLVTVTTATNCWTSGQQALTADCKKRKRSILNDSIDFGKTEMAPENDIDPSIIDVEEQDSQREGRFFLYWLTTTSISTTTAFSYTATTSISVACTPADISQCG